MDIDRNLLFGVLALQADLIDPARFARACTDWATRQDTSLADLLIERGWLTPAGRADLENQLRRQIGKHGGDAWAGLAEVTTDPVRRSPAGIGGADTPPTVLPSTPVAGQEPIRTTDYVPEARDRYTLTRLHATGGIGRIWLARDASLGRDVALKELLPERAGNAAVGSRFRREAQVTGQLEHPGIVPVYELAQRPADQQPYYTMRFVRGRTLAEAAAAYHQRRKKGQAVPLDLRELLSAFVGVCNAVAYAHSRGVLHRDLKPQNVVLGDFGEVIVLDWGLAKVLGEGNRDEPSAGPAAAVSGERPGEETVAGQVLGTPAYMAPEQAEGRLDLLGPATDVYGLGAILYEILAGHPPFRGPDAREVMRQVAQESPVSPRAIVPDTPRPLVVVCLKALARRPGDRYGSARELAGDVQHWLADEPVSAYPEPLAARAGRWARRRRSLVLTAVAALLVAVLSLGGALAMVNAAREGERQAKELALRRESEVESERDRAQHNFALARKAVDEYLSKVSESPELKARGLEQLRKELLETAARFYKEFVRQRSDDPAVRAEQGRGLMRLADLTADIESPAEAAKLFGQALAVFDDLGQSHPDEPRYQAEAATCHNALGMLWRTLGKPMDAERAMLRGLGLREELVRRQPDSPAAQNDLAASCNMLGLFYRDTGRPTDAEDLFDRARKVREKLVEDHPANLEYLAGLAKVYNNLANFYRAAGRLKPAEDAFEKSLAIDERLVRANPQDTQTQLERTASLNNLANLYRATGRTDLAEETQKRSMEIRKGLVHTHPAVAAFRAELAKSHHNLGNLYRSTGRPGAAEESYREALVLREQLARDHPNVPEYVAALAGLHNSMGILYRDTRRKEQAEAECGKALNLRRGLAEAQPRVVEYRQDLAASYNNLGNLYSDTDRPAEAAKAYREALRIREALAAEHPGVPGLQADLAASHLNLAVFLRERGRVAEAGRAARQALEAYRPLARSESGAVEYRQGLASAHLELGVLYQMMRKPAESEAALREALAIQEALHRDNPKATGLALDLADTYCMLGHLGRDFGRSADAVGWYTRSLEQVGQVLDVQPPNERTRLALRRAHQGRAIVLTRLKRYQEALPDWDRRVELDKGLSREWVLLQRARVYAILGQHTRAEAEAEAVARRVPREGDLLRDAACVLALAATAAGADTTLPAEERRRRTGSCSDRAVGLLRQAVAEGYKDAKRLRQDPDLAPLRQREDFRALVAGLEARRKSGSP